MIPLILNTHDTGGAANACVRLHEGLQAIGIASDLLVLEQQKALKSSYDYKDYLKQNWKWRTLLERWRYNKKIHRFRLTHPDVSAFTFTRSPYLVHQHPLVQQADIINLHWVSYFLDYPSFFQNCKQPIVWTLHDMQAFTGGYHYDTDFPFERFTDLLEQQLAIKKESLKGKKITIVCPSKWLLEESKASELFGDFEHHLIPYGLDMQLFRPHDKEVIRKELGIPLKQKVVLFVATGVNIKRKGFHFLLEALPYLKGDIGIYALGNKQTTLDEKQVVQVGKITKQEDMSKWYAAADLFVIPSTADNLPNTVLESIACGTAVVGFPVGGIPDMIQEGRNGFLCSDISSANLAETIEKALNYPFSPIEIRKDAVTRFDQKVQAKAYLKLFEQLLEKKQS